MICITTTACSKEDNKEKSSQTTTTTAQENAENSIIIDFSINGEILAKYDINVPNGGKILIKTNVKAEKNFTAFDLLKKLCIENNITFEYSGDGDTLFITSIGGFSDKTITTDAGWAGWIYKINDESAMESCAKYKLKNGDKIEFIYTDGTFF